MIKITFPIASINRTSLRCMLLLSLINVQLLVAPWLMAQDSTTSQEVTFSPDASGPFLGDSVLTQASSSSSTLRSVVDFVSHAPLRVELSRYDVYKSYAELFLNQGLAKEARLFESLADLCFEKAELLAARELYKKSGAQPLNEHWLV
jgi:hypothetical protein